MGILDVGSTILTKFKSDSSQQRADMKRLSGAERERHKALVQGLDEQNSKMDRHIATLAKVAVGVGAAVVAYRSLKTAFDFYAERQQMYAAGAGPALQRLKIASRGLMTETKLLKIEAQLLNGAVKMSHPEMEQAIKLMLALRKEGFEFNKVQEVVLKAFIELDSGPLKEFGILTKEATGSLKLQAEMFDIINEKVEKFNGNLDIAGDNNVRVQTRLTDAADKLREAWGKFARDILPPLIDAMAELVDQLYKFLKGIENAAAWMGKKWAKHGKPTVGFVEEGFSGLWDAGKWLVSGKALDPITSAVDKRMGWGKYSDAAKERKQKKLEVAALKREKAQRDKFNADVRASRAKKTEAFKGEHAPGDAFPMTSKKGLHPAALAMPFIGISGPWADIERRQLSESFYEQAIPTVAPVDPMIAQRKLDKMNAKQIAAFRKRKKATALKKYKEYQTKRKAHLEKLRKLQEMADAELFRLATRAIEQESAPPGINDPGWDEYVRRKMKEKGDPLYKAAYGIKDPVREKYKIPFDTDADTKMEKFLGKIGTMDAETIGINALSNAFNGLAEAFGAGVGAVIDGSDSFVGAMKKMVGASLKGIAIQESIEAFKHAAYAIGSLAWQDYRGAALHGKAAAMHAGVALMAGVGARQLGVGAKAPSTVSAGAGRTTTTRQQTIILGADFETDSARRRSHRLSSILAQANRTGAGQTVVEFG